MGMSNEQFPSFNLVAITSILDELSINFAPGYLMNREKLGIPLRKALIEQLYAMQEDTLVINMAGIQEFQRCQGIARALLDGHVTLGDG